MTAPRKPTPSNGTISDTYDKVSERVAGAYEVARDRAAGAAETAASEVEANPLIALVGGLALGAIAGALLPRSDQERQLLAPVGGRIGDAARAALEAARAAGKDALAESGLSTENLRGQASSLFEQAFKAAGTAGTAAVSAARDAAAR